MYVRVIIHIVPLRASCIMAVFTHHITPMCDPSLGSLGAVSQIKISAVGFHCAFIEYVAHRLLGMAARALAAGC